MAKLRSRYDRGGGVTHFSNTYWGPININDGGRDAPTEPPSPKTRVVLWTVLIAAVVAAIVVVAVSI